MVILAVSFVLAGYYWYRNTQVDTSWVETANNLLNNYQSYLNDTAMSNPAVTMSYLRMYVYENGTDRLLYYGDGDTLSNYLTNLLKQATIQKGTITRTELDEILASNKAVVLTYRMFARVPSHYYSEAYFILEDNQNEGTKGAIIAKDSPSANLNILAVSKLP